MDENSNTQPVQQSQQVSDKKTNVLAILSLIFAFFFPLLGIIFGIIALVQIGKNPGMKGKGLAIAGIIISVVWFVLVLMLIGMFAYFGVLSPNRFIPSKCVMIGGFSCNEYTVSGGTAIITLQNNVGVDVEKVTLKLESECTPKDATISNGDVLTFNCPIKTGKKGESYHFDMLLNYVLSGGTEQKTSTGTVSGQLS